MPHFLFAPACRIAAASHSKVLAADAKQRTRNSRRARVAHALIAVSLFMVQIFVFLPFFETARDGNLNCGVFP